jgi:hypothetical protein
VDQFHTDFARLAKIFATADKHYRYLNELDIPLGLVSPLQADDFEHTLPLDPATRI